MSLSHLTDVLRAPAFALWLAVAMPIGLVTGAALAAGDRDDAPAARPSATATQYQTAKTAIEQKRYAVTIPEKFIKDRSRHAGAHNYLAFAHRKLGRLDVAYKLYQKALELDPKHRGAHEYLGELYLQRDDLSSAEAMLKKLDGLCFFGCEEYDELKQAIARYKAAKAKKS